MNPIPYYFKLPSGRLLPFLSEPIKKFSEVELEQLELVAQIGFHKDGMPIKSVRAY